MPVGELPSVRTIEHALEERRQRSAELSDQLGKIQARIETMNADVQELEVALRVLRVLQQGAALAPARRRGRPPGVRTRRTRGRSARILEGCVESLKQHDGMANAADTAKYLMEHGITTGDRLTSSYVTAVRTMRRYPSRFEESRQGRHVRFRLLGED